MKNLKWCLPVIISVIILGSTVYPVYAQTPAPVTVEVDRRTLSINEILVLTVTIDATYGNLSPPVLPALNNFEILGSSSGKQIQVINGDMSVQTTYRYQLLPTQTGDLVIDPISVTVNGSTYISEPLPITVTQGNNSPSPAAPQPLSPSFPSIPGFPLFQLPGFGIDPHDPVAPRESVDPNEAPNQLVGQDLFVEAEVDNPTPYHGEQVLYTFRFYRAVNLDGDPTYDKPDFTGFWSNPEPEQMEFSIKAGGRTYLVTELQTVIFPTVAGEITIDPAKMIIPDGFFNRGGILETAPITVNVQPLPGTPPEDFMGAVGRFDILAGVDKTETKVNDAVTHKIMLSGQGNLEILPDLEWAQDPNWRAFDSKSSLNTVYENKVLNSSQVYERVLVPTTPGTHPIPAVNFTYFDPVLVTYQRISTEAFTIMVAPEDKSAVVINNTAEDQNTGGDGLSNELRPIKSIDAIHGDGDDLITGKASYWMLWGLPLFFLVGQFGLQQRQKRLINNPEIQRNRRAAKKAHKALHEASKQPDGGRDAVARIILNYLGDKLNQSVLGLTQSELSSLLLAKGVGPDLVEKVSTCLMFSEMGQYAPQNYGSLPGDLHTQTKQLINELEKNL